MTTEELNALERLEKKAREWPDVMAHKIALVDALWNHARALIRSAREAKVLRAEVEAWRAMQDRTDDIYTNGPHAGPQRMVAAQHLGKLVADTKLARASTDLYDKENPA